MKTYSDKLKDPRWQKLRLKILERDEWSCVFCGEDKVTLNVHHITYSANPWDALPDHLITLCNKCHIEEEISLKENSNILIKRLKNSGFTSCGFLALSKIFNKDRGWTHYDPVYDILKMAIEDDNIWSQLHEIYFKKLANKRLNKDI